MKELYIPRGKTVSLSHVEAERIIIKGVLNVDTTVRVRRIMGDGVLVAGHVSAGSVTASDIEAATVTAKRLAADRVVAAELHISRSAAVRDYLEAEFVETPRLTVYQYEVEELRAKRVTRLPDKRGGLLTTILISQLRTAWCAMRAWWEEKSMSAGDVEVQDADYVQVEGDTAQQEPQQPRDIWNTGFDMEFERKRLNALFDLLDGQGYLLRIVPKDGARKSPGTATHHDHVSGPKAA